MAHMHPQRYPGSVWAESVVFEALEHLSNEWHVVADAFFPVERRHQATLDGQVDFILLHPEHGAIVLEVKGGDVVAEGGSWTSRNREGTFEIKDPFKQAAGYKHVLRRLVEEQTGVSVWFSHAVSLPVVPRRDARIGPHSPDIVLFAEDIENPRVAIDRIVAYHDAGPQRMTPEQVRRVVAVLAPTVTLERRLVDRSGEAKTEQLTLTHNQRVGFEMSREYRRLWVTGGAGTGKTVLAVARARELGEAGQRVLLLCFNAPLGSHLRQQVEDLENVMAGHFHHVATRLGGSKPHDVDDGDWLSVGLADAMLAAHVEDGRPWDAVIVDEGQDFETHWLDALELMLADDGRLIVFSDANQAIFRGRGRAGLPAEPFVLTINCRNTPEIHRRANDVIGIEIPCLRPSGIEPTLQVVPGDLMKPLRRAVHEIIVDGGIAPEDVAILSPSRPFVDAVQATQIGRWKPVAVDGGAGLVCETVQRFKGLEADAVVLALPVEAPITPELLYVGMTRARTVLTVLAEEAAARTIIWSGPTSQRDVP